MNVLFVVYDDLRPELNCYSKEQIISPNIDALARDGILTERAYCEQAVYAPSRTSVLSGCGPDTTTIYDLRTPLREAMAGVLSLPEHFKNNDYETVSLFITGGIEDDRTKQMPLDISCLNILHVSYQLMQRRNLSADGL